jgi:hypothetical protein
MVRFLWEFTLGIGKTLEIFQTRGNVEKVRIQLNNSVRTGRINGRRILMKTSGIPSKSVAFDVIFPNAAVTHSSSIQENEKESPSMRGR